MEVEGPGLLRSEVTRQILTPSWSDNFTTKFAKNILRKKCKVKMSKEYEIEKKFHGNRRKSATGIHFVFQFH